MDKKDELIKELGKIIHDQTVVMQAAWIDWKQHIHVHPVACNDEPDAHNVIFKVGVQSFVIGCIAQESKEHAEWFAAQFIKALENASSLKGQSLPADAEKRDAAHQEGGAV